MKKLSIALIAFAITFGFLAPFPQLVNATLTTPKLTVTPTTCETVAQFVFTCQNSAQFDEIQIQFPPAFVLPTTISTSSIYVMGANVTSVTVSGQTIRITTNTYPPTPPFSPYQMQVTIYTTANVKNPPCASCGLQNITLSSLLSSAVNGSMAYSYTVESKTANATVVVDPPTTQSQAQYDMTFRLGACGALAAGQNIVITFPSGTQLPYTNINKDYVRISNGAAFPLGPFYTPSSVTVSGMNVTIVLPSAIPANDYVQIVFLNSFGIKNPYTAGYMKLSIYTSVELFMMESQLYPIANHPVVTAYPNSINSGPAEYKITWTLPTGVSLSGNNGDWIEVSFANEMPLNPPVISSITNTFPPTPPSSTCILQNSTYGTLYYSTSITATGTKRLQIVLPPGFEVLSGGQLVVTFTAGAGLINTATPGSYRIYIRHSKFVSSYDWIPSDAFSIYDAVQFVPGDSYVRVKPPTVIKPAQYTVKFRVGTPGRLNRGTGTITINFPSGTIIPYNMSAGSVWMIWGANPAMAEFNPSFDCPPQPATGSTYTAYQLDLNPKVNGQSVTLTVPMGAAADILDNDYVVIRFCLSANITNPATVGNYTLQIKTTTQPNYAVSPFYRIANTITQVSVKPTPNTVCSTKTQYEIQFYVGSSGTLSGNAGDYIDIDWGDQTVPDPIQNPAPDFSSIQNTFNSATAPMEPGCWVSPPFTGYAARWDIIFKTGVALVGGTSTVTLIFPPTVTLPATFPANSIYMSTNPFELIDPSPPAAPAAPAVDVTGTAVISGQRVTLTVPSAFAVGAKIYTRFRNIANVVNPTAPGSTYSIQIQTRANPTTDIQTPTVSTNFGITNDYISSGPASAVDAQWAGHYVSVVPTLFPAHASAQSQYVFSFQVAAANPLTATSTLTLQFPPGTVIPSTISPASIRISDQPTAGPTPPFVFDETTGTPGLQPVSVATDPTNRRITITGPATTAGNTNIYVLIRKDAGIRNPSNPSISNQISINLDNTGSPNDGVATMSEFYAIIPPPIGGAALPPNSIKMGGGYYYSGYFTNYVTNVQVLSPKRLRLWIPAGMQFQQSQPVTITFTDVANLVNTCTAGSYKIRVSTSQEPEAIDSLPYSIVDAVQFTCGEYPKVDPPTISAEGVYDLSFTVGPTGGLNANVDSITVAFPSQTTMPYNMAAGGI
ncbi:MAG TPA: hypothetical protein PLK43_07995, partial [Caldisericia bacterium]|nr:hypothetical protein [Caldisericia bacterium]